MLVSPPAADPERQASPSPSRESKQEAGTADETARARRPSKGDAKQAEGKVERGRGRSEDEASGSGSDSDSDEDRRERRPRKPRAERRARAAQVEERVTRISNPFDLLDDDD